MSLRNNPQSQNLWKKPKKKNNTKNNNKNKIEEEKQNINKSKNIKVNKSNKNISGNKSVHLNIKSPIIKKENNKRSDLMINKNRRSNKSAEKRIRSNTNATLDFQKEQKNITSKLNKSVEKRRNKKEKEKELNKSKNSNSLSIFTACENLKNSSFIAKVSKQRKTSCNEQNININKNNRRNTYYNQYQDYGIGIKKKILGNNIIRPSNMANKLLLKGINYINEFKNLKEEESKKKY